MPNWCSQTLTIKGTKTNIKKFKKDQEAYVASKGGKKNDGCCFSFNVFKEMPEALNKLDHWVGTNAREGYEPTAEEKAFAMEQFQTIDTEQLRKKVREVGGGTSSWYDWNCANWGTKWDACNPSLDTDTDEELLYSYDTAWSPAVPAIEQASLKYPKLTFRLCYTEESSAFCGMDEYQGGVKTDGWEMEGEPETIYHDHLPYILAILTMSNEDLPLVLQNENDIDCDSRYLSEDTYKEWATMALNEGLSGKEDITVQDVLHLIGGVDFEGFPEEAKEIFCGSRYMSEEELTDGISTLLEEEITIKNCIQELKNISKE